MEKASWAVVAVLLAAAVVAGEGPLPKSGQIEGEGCVEPGVVMRCLVVKGIKSGKLYNLLIKGAQPRIGEGIEFTGLPHAGSNLCMQGIPIDVLTWARKPSIKCPQPSKPKEPSPAPAKPPAPNKPAKPAEKAK